MEIFKLFGGVYVDNDKANESMKKTDTLASKMGQGFQTAGKLAVSAGKVIATGVGAVSTAMGGVVAKTLETVSTIDKFSATTNTSVEEFQRLDGVFKTMGWSMESAAGDFAALSEKMLDAQEGSGEAYEMFDKLGVSTTNLDGSLRNTGDVFNDMILSLQNVGDETERQAIASIMLGTTSEELAPLLKMTNEEFKAMKDNVNVIDEKNINQTLEFKKSWDNLKQTFETVVTELGTSLMPVFQSLSEWVIANMPQIKSVIEKTFDVVGEIIGVTVEVIQTLISWFQNIVDEANTTGSETNKIWTEIKKFFMDTFNNIIEFVKAFIQLFQAFWEKWGDTITIYLKGVWEQIKIIFDVAFKIINDLLKIFTALFKGDWEGLWEGIKQLCIDIWNGINALIQNSLEVALNILKNIIPKMLQAGKNIMMGVWDGIKGVWENICNWVEEKVEWLADKLTFWDNGVQDMSKSTPSNYAQGNSSNTNKKTGYYNGSHADGLAYVPFDGYVAQLHQGERVLTKEENKVYQQTNSTDTSKMEYLLETLIREVKNMPKEQKRLSRMGVI